MMLWALLLLLGAAPALQQGAFDGGGFHSTRWVNAGS